MHPKERARLAEEIFRNDVFHLAFDYLEQVLIAEWKSSSPEAWKARERTYDRLQALIDVKAQLENFIHTAALDSTATGTAWTHRKV
jgi:hypothetical protein